MFICKAKTEYGKKEAIGYYTQIGDNEHWIISDNAYIEKGELVDYTWAEYLDTDYMTLIDPSTLTISFDGGESFRSVVDIAEILKDIPMCKVCNDKGVNHGCQKGSKYYSEPCSFCDAKDK